MNKLKQNENKNHLKRQIYDKKLENLEKWKNELQLEKKIIGNQISKKTKKNNLKGIMINKKTKKGRKDMK